MLNVFVVGCNGRMGQLICDLIEQSDDMVVIGGYDCYNEPRITNFKVEEADSDIKLDDVDVIIDFSHPPDTVSVVKAAVKYKVPMVISTAGFSDKEESIIEEASQVIPIFRRANYSINADALSRLLSYVDNDTNTITHRTEILTVFAEGAINCAKFLANTKNILFDQL